MAKSKRKTLADDLHARGLRKRVARTLAGAIGSGSHTRTPDLVTRVAGDLNRLARELEDRATGRPAKRRAAARKGAETRARRAKARSNAAKKGARKRTTASARGRRS